MLNKIVIMGRLTRDVELRQTASGVPVASFSVAVERDIKNKDTGERGVDFIDVVAWRGTGEFAAKWFSKGSMVVVDGRLQIRNWEDDSGNKHRAAEVVADNVYFGESKKDDGNAASGSAPAKAKPAAPKQSTYTPDEEYSDEDSELPF